MTIEFSSDAAKERREHILRATVRCIALHGYDRVRLRDVSKEAKVSVGLVQHYFESRDQLIDTAITLASDELIATWDSMSRTEMPAWNRVQSAIRHLVAREDLWTHCVIWVEFSRAVTRHEHLRERHKSVYDAWEGQFRQMLADGEREGSFRPPIPSEQAVRSLLSFFDGLELEIATGLAPADPQIFEERCLAVVKTLFGFQSVESESDAAD